MFAQRHRPRLLGENQLNLYGVFDGHAGHRASGVCVCVCARARASHVLAAQASKQDRQHRKTDSITARHHRVTRLVGSQNALGFR